MKRSILFTLCGTFLTVGCGEEPKPSSTLPPIGDRFEKGKELLQLHPHRRPLWFPQNQPRADLLSRRFTRAARQFGFGEARTQLDCQSFAVPALAAEAAPAQMSLF